MVVETAVPEISEVSEYVCMSAAFVLYWRQPLSVSPKRVFVGLGGSWQKDPKSYG